MKFSPLRMSETPFLQGRTILQTRPAHQQQPLNQLLQQAGANILAYPTIAIHPVALSESERHDLKTRLQSTDLAIFVSRNAIAEALKHIPASDWPAGCQLAVIGSSSARYLQQQGLSQNFAPEREFNSEGLLQELEKNPQDGCNIVIFRGQEGRNLLGDRLRELGATVSYIEIYRRAVPQKAAVNLSDWLSQQSLDMVLLTSAEGMHNLHSMAEPEVWQQLCAYDWCLISPRMQTQAQQLGHTGRTFIATEASDKGIMQTLKIWVESPQDD